MTEATTPKLITDIMMESAAKVFAEHEFRVNGPEMVPFCPCGWTGTERYGVAGYDQHVARLILEAVAPLIADRVDSAHEWRRNPMLSHAYVEPVRFLVSCDKCRVSAEYDDEMKAKRAAETHDDQIHSGEPLQPGLIDDKIQYHTKGNL